jgi:preprotein translocase subunit SecE
MIKYIKNSIKEVQKVTWPKKEDALKLTIITLIFTLLTTLGLTLVDKVLNAGYQYLLDLSPATYEAQETPEININSVNTDGGSITIGESESSTLTEEPEEETAEAETE